MSNLKGKVGIAEVGVPQWSHNTKHGARAFAFREKMSWTW